MPCSQFEALLAEALDGALPQQFRPAFEAHGQTCPSCGPMLAEAREGMLLLAGLEEVEPPRNLLHNILAATTMAEARLSPGTVPTQVVQTGWWEKLFPSRRQSGWAGVLHSRFVTSFCMAFFSLSLTLAVAGVKIGDLTKIDWHPSAIRKSVMLEYTQVEARVQRYYDNMRLVVELEARVRGLKKAAQPVPEDNNNRKPEQQNRNATPDTSGRPQEHEDYSLDRDGSLLASVTLRSEGANRI
jgi:hypothetical protein